MTTGDGAETTDGKREEADRRFEDALAASGARDPREYYRERLRELKAESPHAYERAVDYFDRVLVADVASGDVDPVQAWLAYGRELAELTAPGTTVEVDPSGKRHPHSAPTAPDRLVLHLPDQRNRRAILVGLPPELTPPQRATYDLLVAGRLKIHGG